MFKPKIVPFVCDWCSLQSADFIGLTRLFFPKKVSFIRVPCSGRVNPEIVSMAFKEGADGVLVMGCEKGACNYRTGNFQAERWTEVYRMVLELSGLNPDRLYLNLESDTEIIHVFERFYKTVEEMGPIGTEIGAAGNREKINEIFEIIDLTLLDEDVKWLVGREWTLVTVENAYGEIYDEATFKRILKERINQQFLIAQIQYLTKDKPMSTHELAKALGRSTEEIFRTIVEMERKEKAVLVDFVDRTPRYQSVR